MVRVQGWALANPYLCPKTYERIYAPGDSIPMAIGANLWEEFSGYGVNITAIRPHSQNTWPIEQNTAQFNCP